MLAAMMQLEAPERDVPADRTVLQLPPAALLVVAGVPGEHFLRILLALPGPTGLIVHDTGTRDWRRRLLVSLARRCGRTGHLLLLDVTAKAALVGQQRRRRTLRRSAMAGHWHRWRQLRAQLPTPGGPDADPTGLLAEGWTSVRLLARPAADRLNRVVIPRR